MKVVHIINPFVASAESDLHFAQPVTFASMRLAREQAPTDMQITLMVTCFEEDIAMAPDDFIRASFLKRSVYDIQPFSKKIRLPLIADILQKAYEESDAEYIIYTNVDIGLYPHFYKKVHDLIQKGHDAFIINRTRLPVVYTNPEDLDKILQQKGKSHPGFDCFIFHRSLFPNMKLGNICIGVPFIEITLGQNLFHLAQSFTLVESNYHTFHIGMEIFKGRAPKEYFIYNKKEFQKIVPQLMPVMQVDNLPYANQLLPVRLMKWGLHPCIPIKLAMNLQWKKWKNT